MRVFRYALMLAAALVLRVGAADAASPADPSAGPRLQLEELSFDFGQVVEGTVLEHAFKVFNRGDQTLIIENVSPS